MTMYTSYVAVSTRMLTPLATGTQSTRKGKCWCKPRSQRWSTKMCCHAYHLCQTQWMSSQSSHASHMAAAKLTATSVHEPRISLQQDELKCAYMTPESQAILYFKGQVHLCSHERMTNPPLCLQRGECHHPCTGAARMVSLPVFELIQCIERLNQANPVSIKNGFTPCNSATCMRRHPRGGIRKHAPCQAARRSLTVHLVAPSLCRTNVHLPLTLLPCIIQMHAETIPHAQLQNAARIHSDSTS